MQDHLKSDSILPFQTHFPGGKLDTNKRGGFARGRETCSQETIKI